MACNRVAQNSYILIINAVLIPLYDVDSIREL